MANDDKKIKENIPTLVLTQEEITKISTVAKDRKFLIKNVEPLYPRSELDKVNYFLDSYRFLAHIATTLERDEAIKKKITEYLGKVTDLYKKLIEMRAKYYNSPAFNKHRLKNKLVDCAIDNILLMDAIIDSTFPIGRSVKMYNPEEDTAVA
jgi:hypothetical protein